MQGISAFNQLVHLTSTQKLRLIHVIGLPRSNGTALHLALTQASQVHGQINEPFFYPDMKGRKWNYIPSERYPRSFDVGCQHILDRYKREVEAKAVGCVTLVVHDLAQDLLVSEFNQLRKIDSHIVFVARHPGQQAMSLLTRYVNDKLSSPEGNLLTHAEVLHFMSSDEHFAKFLGEHPEKFSKDLMRNLLEVDAKTDFEMTPERCRILRQKVLEVVKDELSLPWENMQRFVMTMRIASHHKKMSIMDGSTLVSDPEQCLFNLTNKIGSIFYSPDMVHNWTKGVGSQFDCVITKKWGDLAHTNAWNGPVRNSKGIIRQKESVEHEISVSQFPQELQGVIERNKRIFNNFIEKPKKSSCTIPVVLLVLCFATLFFARIHRV